MPYKVYLVEDEVTTREGIRDKVEWQAAGFELCGESPDGEIALPQIEATQPDVLITDIKMPFMDGLQLSKIVREHMPWMKIIIISGYSDFQFAQTAIQLGVTEYLLKPISVQDLRVVLSRLKSALDKEERERVYLKNLRSQVEDNLLLLREKFLMRLVTGGESSLSAIEQSQQLGLNILSPYYQVALLEIQPQAEHPDYETCQKFEKVVVELVRANQDVLLTKKDMTEFVLILKGESPEQLEQEGPFLADLIRGEVEKSTGCRVRAGVGSPEQHLGNLHRSFVGALMNTHGAGQSVAPGSPGRFDHAALQNYLATGVIHTFDAFFDAHIRPLVEASLRTPLLKRYVIMDIVLGVTQFISDLGGNARRIAPALTDEDAFLTRLQSVEGVHTEFGGLFAAALDFRDSQADNDRAGLIQKTRDYIDSHFSDSTLSLNEVAAQANFSPNHFSAVFSEETGGTFRDYLTQARIEHARKLLRTTRLKISEVAYRCGYNDPHYFSVIFRKVNSQSPQEFREAAHKVK